MANNTTAAPPTRRRTIEIPAPAQAQASPQQLTTADAVAELFRHGHDAFLELERAAAGYVTLSRALAEMERPGQRKGLPLMKFVGSVDGVNALEVVSDMERPVFERSHANHALLPHINAFYADCVRLTGEISHLMAQMAQVVSGGIDDNDSTPE